MVKLKILFVCTGNICRSPLAEGIFRNYVESNNLQHKFEIDSAGTAAYHVGNLPDSRSILAAKKQSIALRHIARQITPHDLEFYDFILVMDHRNYEDVLSLSENEQAKNRILLLRSFDPFLGNDMEYTVPDPYYGQVADFEEVFTICKNSIDGFIRYLNSQNLI